MKRTLIGLILTAVLIASVPAAAGLTTITSPANTVCPGWNLISLPGIPVNPDPISVLNGFDISESALYHWDAATQGLNCYDYWAPDQFGNLLLTDGYWLVSNHAGQISYTGLDDNDSMDVWISLPRRGWAMIGNPFNHDFMWDNAKVVDGNETVSIYEASREKMWMNSSGLCWDASVQGLGDFGIEDDFVMNTRLQPWRGYWVQSYVDKIALILESS